MLAGSRMDVESRAHPSTANAVPSLAVDQGATRCRYWCTALPDPLDIRANHATTSRWTAHLLRRRSRNPLGATDSGTRTRPGRRACRPRLPRCSSVKPAHSSSQTPRSRDSRRSRVGPRSGIARSARDWIRCVRVARPAIPRLAASGRPRPPDYSSGSATRLMRTFGTPWLCSPPINKRAPGR